MKKIIFFQAHPDDLEFNCAHILHYLAKKNDKYEIKIASMTRGEYGTTKRGSDHFKGERLGRLRTKELLNAQAIHGITPAQIHFFEIVDGYTKFDKETVDLVKTYLDKEKPDIILACEPRNTYYRHPDHMICGKIIYYILDKQFIDFKKQPKLYFYSSINANFRWPFNNEDLPLAYQLILSHKSQYYMFKSIKPVYRFLSKRYGRHLKGWKYAEGYRRVYYGKKKPQNQKLKLYQRVFLLLNVKIWPEKITRHEIKLE